MTPRQHPESAAAGSGPLSNAAVDIKNSTVPLSAVVAAQSPRMVVCNEFGYTVLRSPLENLTAANNVSGHDSDLANASMRACRNQKILNITGI